MQNSFIKKRAWSLYFFFILNVNLLESPCMVMVLVPCLLKEMEHVGD